MRKTDDRMDEFSLSDEHSTASKHFGISYPRGTTNRKPPEFSLTARGTQKGANRFGKIGLVTCYREAIASHFVHISFGDIATIQDMTKLCKLSMALNESGFTPFVMSVVHDLGKGARKGTDIMTP